MGRDWAEVFDVETAAELLEHVTEDTYRGRSYRHLTDGRHGVERGTVIVDGAVVRGFPSIPRTLVLDPGVPDFFDGPIAVEEKLNGYNVRVAAIARDRDPEDPDPAGWPDDADPIDDLMAFTRSGYVCHYTTERARALLDPGDFFADHPEYVLCCELVGPENPYTTHDYADVDSLSFRVFDVRERETGRPLPVEERRELCAEYGFEQVPHLGTYEPDEAPAAVREHIERLDEQGREGVVMKSADGTQQLKYTTSAIHRADLAHAFSMPFDYGRDFLFARLIREAFQAVEFDESPAERRERARDLGEALLLPAIETIQDVQAGEPVGEPHTVRGAPGAVEALLAQFRDWGLEVVVESDREDDGERVVEFVKVASSTRDKTQHYLDGGTIDQ